MKQKMDAKTAQHRTRHNLYQTNCPENGNM